MTRPTINNTPSAASSTTRPRAALTRYADGFTRPSAWASISFSVSAVSGQVRATNPPCGNSAFANQILAEQFDTVMPLLKELYRRLRPHAEWTEIESDFGGRVRASLNFTVGDGHNVQFLFSSGQ
jgi:hypothetical protein